MWSTVFIFIACIIYILYNITTLKLFGIPKSLSNTYYLYQEKKSWMKMLFPIMMISISVFLMPAWLEISLGSNLQFLAFLAVGGILFTGAAPAFKHSKLEDRVHTISAICAAVFSLLWVFFVSNAWWTILIWTVIVIFCSIKTKTLNKCLIYWLETIAFMSTLSSILIYLI